MKGDYRMMKTRNLLLLLLVISFGCAGAQPERVAYFADPQVVIGTNDTDLVKTKLIDMMSFDGYYIFNESTHRIIFRKEIPQSFIQRNALAIAVMQSAEGTDAKDFETAFQITKQQENTKITTRMYMVFVHRYSGQVANKHDMNKNNRWFNDMQSKLEQLKSEIESVI